jgi:HD-GYP domain-containing protein (c-di-GMP phosphodiesterase class II)
MVTGVAVALAKELGYPAQRIEFIRVAAVLHDYGKIAIPDAILMKPGRLTADEFGQMRSHAGKTIEILSRVYFTKDMRKIPEIAGMHHERLDGTGYPSGLKNGEIPQEGRILAVADVFHALLQERPYKKAFTPREALAECKKLTAPHIGRFGDEEGTHLDIEVVDALERILEREYYDPAYFARESGWGNISTKEMATLAEQYSHERSRMEGEKAEGGASSDGEGVGDGG